MSDENKYIIELEFTHKGLECVVIFTDMGHRCGYVGVEEGSPLFGIDYDEPIIVAENGDSLAPEDLFGVPGGLNYSDDLCHAIDKKRPLWWFGFDCAHCNDSKDYESTLKYFGEERCEALRVYEDLLMGEVKTLEYVVNACKNLAKQIVQVVKTYK